MKENFFVTEPVPEGLDDSTAAAMAYEARQRAFGDVFNALSAKEMASLTKKAQKKAFLEIQKELIKARFKEEQNCQFRNLSHWERPRIEELVEKWESVEYEEDF